MKYPLFDKCITFIIDKLKVFFNRNKLSRVIGESMGGLCLKDIVLCFKQLKRIYFGSFLTDILSVSEEIS